MACVESSPIDRDRFERERERNKDALVVLGRPESQLADEVSTDVDAYLDRHLQGPLDLQLETDV